MIAWIPANILKTGDYFVGFGFFNHQINTVFARGLNVETFRIVQKPDDSKVHFDELPGIINPIIKWQEKKI
ncbi:MAG: hypothetical protein IPL08_13765 [Saprospiraceae bacterium]|nr:hypothetical protein [Saprospiraceae bacterium]